MALILGGVNVTYVSQELNLSLSDHVSCSVYALAAFASYYLIEKVGRRKMFLAGSAGQCVSMIIIFAW